MFTKKFVILLTALLFAVLGTTSVAQEESEPIYGGTIVALANAAGQFSVNFNPFSPGNINFGRDIIYEPLILRDSAHPTEVNYWLATAYELSEDLTSITFTLREGVTWSDGETFNADDVVFTFNMFAEYPGTDFYGVLTYFDSIEKVDDYTVTINLTRPSSLAPSVFGQVNIVAEHTWGSVEDPVLFTNENPVGTGPFTEVSVASGEVLELCKNESYWQEGKPYLDCVRFRFFNSNDTADLAIINGEIEWSNAFIADIENTYVAASEYNKIADWTNGVPVFLYVNHTSTPLDDVEFRMAISQAINYEEMLMFITDGRSNPATDTGIPLSMSDAWLSADAVALAEETGFHQYDPEAARARLDAAGYVDVDGDGFRELPDGSQMVIRGLVVGQWTDFVNVLQFITQYLQVVGIRYEIDAKDFGQVFGDLRGGNYDTAIWFGTQGVEPWTNYRNMLDSRLVTEEGAGGTAFLRWQDEETDALLDAFVQTADMEEQFEILSRLQTIFVENAVNIPLFTRFTTYTYNTRRFTGFPTNENYYASGNVVGNPARLLIITNIHCNSEEACAQ